MNIERELTGFQRDLLQVIAQNNGCRGLVMKDEIEERYDQPVNHGRLYPNLDKLVDAGLVEKGTIDDRTNSYTLTHEGRNAVHLMMNNWVSADAAKNLDDAAAD